MDDLLRGFMQAGLLQFGSFSENGETRPLQFYMEYLPSYPDLMGQLAIRAWKMLEGYGLDRLLVPVESLPLGVRVSSVSGLPLVWGQVGETQQYDLIGAFDTGHRTAVLTNVLVRPDALLPMIKQAGRVGLDVPVVYTLIDPGIHRPVDGLQVEAQWKFPQLIDDLSQAGLLPAGQREQVERWLEVQAGAIPRPDAAGP